MLFINVIMFKVLACEFQYNMFKKISVETHIKQQAIDTRNTIQEIQLRNLHSTNNLYKRF